jgi:hypothetical protein
MKAQAAGLQPGTPEYQNAAKIALGQDSRASNAGMKSFNFTGSDGRERIGRFDPRTGSTEIYNEQSGQFEPFGGAQKSSGGPATAPPVPQVVGNIDPTSIAPNAPLVQLANSYIAQGQSPEQAAQNAMARVKPTNGAGLHMDPGGTRFIDVAGTPNAADYGRPAAPPGLGVGRPAEEQASAVQNAKNASDLTYLPQTESVKSNVAVQQAGQTVTAKGLAERELDRPQATASLSDANNNLDRLASTARSVMNHPGLNGITSWNSKIPDLPGSEAADARAELETLKSQIGFSVLAAMRAASKTGGALGSISDAEGERLNNNLAALQNSQSPDAFRANLQKIIDYTQSAKSRLATAYTQTYHSQNQGDSDVPQAVAPAASPSDGDYSHLWN